MSERKLNGTTRTLLDLGPIAVFFVTYMLIRDREFVVLGTSYEGFIVAAFLFVPVILAATGLTWRLTGKLSPMQLVTAVVVVAFGGLTVWFNDERFFKMKPTIIYVLFGGALGFGLLRGRSYLRLVMDEYLLLSPEGWMALTRRLALFFVALAVANEFVWRMFSTDIWVSFKTFVLPVAVFAFFMAHTPFLARHYRADDG